ncbi:hypothetical protein QAD02_021472 [Eretmocerus hayati]|uniref:Uncharacterized protein n=1 Tax=Eretmocerus hayati TaxID=131215 RepID=A0ACC2PQV3_9HYME|nr:hypothetical protein QAD02_021472 [Eretmocerus hayati]
MNQDCDGDDEDEFSDGTPLFGDRLTPDLSLSSAKGVIQIRETTTLYTSLFSTQFIQDARSIPSMGSESSSDNNDQEYNHGNDYRNDTSFGSSSAITSHHVKSSSAFGSDLSPIMIFLVWSIV